MSWLADVLGILSFFITLGTYLSVKAMKVENDQNKFIKEKYKKIEKLKEYELSIKEKRDAVKENGPSIAVIMEHSIHCVEEIAQLSIWSYQNKKKLKEISSYCNIVEKLKTPLDKEGEIFAASADGIQKSLDTYVEVLEDIIGIISRQN